MEKMIATMTTKPNYESEIIKIVKGNGSPKVILNQLEKSRQRYCRRDGAIE